jgi:hypothetical protein
MRADRASSSEKPVHVQAHFNFDYQINAALAKFSSKILGGELESFPAMRTGRASSSGETAFEV